MSRMSFLSGVSIAKPGGRKLMTQPILHQLIQNHMLSASSEGGSLDHRPVLKLFGGASCTWLITEYNPETDMFFGLCDIGQGCAELGYVSKAELEELRFAPMNLPVERDRYFEAKATISVYAHRASEAGRIVESWS